MVEMRPKMLTEARWMPSFCTKVMSLVLIWMVMGTRTVSEVTLTKSERMSKGIRL
jgi:hypothetical protein